MTLTERLALAWHLLRHGELPQQDTEPQEQQPWFASQKHYGQEHSQHRGMGRFSAQQQPATTLEPQAMSWKEERAKRLWDEMKAREY